MKRIKYYNKDTLRWENIDSKIISSSDKYQIYQKLDNYLPKSFAIKRIDLNDLSFENYTNSNGYQLEFYENYNNENQSLLTYDVLLPRYIENNDLKNSLAFIDYSKKSSDMTHTGYYENRTQMIGNINFDGKDYEAVSKDVSSEGNIVEYTREKIENNKHITYYYTCLGHLDDGGENIIIDKFARVELQQYLIENVDETYTLRVELIPKVFIYNGTNVIINSLDVDLNKINDDEFYEYKGRPIIMLNYYGTGYDVTTLAILTDNIENIENKKENKNYIKVTYNRNSSIDLNFDNENTIDLSNEKGYIDGEEIDLKTFIDNNDFGVEFNFSDSFGYENDDTEFNQKFSNIDSFFRNNYFYLQFKIRDSEEYKLYRVKIISNQEGSTITIKFGKIEECKHKCVTHTNYQGNNDKILIYYLFSDKNFKRLEYTEYEKSEFVKLIKKGHIVFNSVVFKLNAVDYFKKINKITEKQNTEKFILKNDRYTSPAYTFTDKTAEVAMNRLANNKMYNNFVITFTDAPNKLLLSGASLGQSGIIKVINAKKINGYDEKIKATITLPVLDKLNDTEYFSYYVFSESEILVSRI